MEAIILKNDMAQIIWNQYQNGLNYFKRSGLSKEWEECMNFYEGDQWPKATKQKIYLDQLLIYVLCSMIADNKKAGILSEKIKLVYNPAEMYGERLEKAQQGSNILQKLSIIFRKK